MLEKELNDLNSEPREKDAIIDAQESEFVEQSSENL